MNDFQELQHQIKVWADQTFAKGTLQGRINHIKRELKEIEDNPSNPEEYADVLIILCHMAASNGVDLYEATVKKFAIVQTRVWGEPDAEGVIEHVRSKDE